MLENKENRGGRGGEGKGGKGGNSHRSFDFGYIGQTLSENAVFILETFELLLQ